MKSMQKILIAVLSGVAFLFSGTLHAQNKEDTKKAAVAALVNAKRFDFIAQSSMPPGPAPDRQLNGQYDLYVTPDSVISYLPYFGRAYTAPIDPTKGGIRFTSVKFDYTMTERKKGGWLITIKPQDTQDARQMTLTVTTSGYATLQVISNNRQPILFNGYIDEKKSK